MNCRKCGGFVSGVQVVCSRCGTVNPANRSGYPTQEV